MASENNFSELLLLAKECSVLAGKEIMKIYEMQVDMGIVSKKDNSPLTLADTASHNVISKFLGKSSIPVLSEEGRNIPLEERLEWDRFWLVDPLDGTKEFIKRNGEFTVNVALIDRGIVTFGVVYVPAMETLYWGGKGMGAFKMDRDGVTEEIFCKKSIEGDILIVASRSHLNEETQIFIDQYPGCKLQNVGSSLKFLQIAEGAAHIYPRFGPTMEWDTGAAQGVVEGAGGYVLSTSDNSPMRYNKADLLNPFFIVCGSKDFLKDYA